MYDQDDFTMKVHCDQVGRIIGRNGSKIKQMQTDSGAKITVSREEDEQGKKTVEIVGDRDQVEKARELIDDCLKYEGRGGGGGFGGRGGYGRDGGGGFGSRNGAGGGGWGRRDDGDRFNDRGGDRYSDRGDRDRGGRRNEQRNFSDDGPKETVYVDSSEVGRIIGRGGSRIRDLENDSGCRIKVSRHDNGGRNSVDLIGSTKQIQEAKKMIIDAGVELVDDSGRVSEGIDPSCDSGNHSKANGATENGSVEAEEVVQERKRPPINWNMIRQNQAEQAKAKFKDLPDIVKNFYHENEEIANMPAEQVKLFRKENNNIIVDCPDGGSENFPNPIMYFEDAFERYPLVLEQIYRQNFEKPSPIQCQAWPVLLQGKDLIGIAQTGTGKTLAFLLPALIHIDRQIIPKEDRTGPSALILSPTRELAQQIEKEVNKINYKGIRSICVYGGGDRREQKRLVQRGVEIVVATPGRLNDFLMNGIMDVKNVTYLVMDEADRMLDLGFELEIKKVMLDIRPDRQTVMTSATWPPEVQRLADSYMTDPYKVFVGTLDLAAVHSVRQYVEIVEDYEKKELILDFIQQMQPSDKVIIFVGKKITADDLSSDLAMANIVCQCIHGDREQCDREAALDEFKSGVVRILVATDVASRGLDVPDITHVINFDFPRHIEEYVHRIGRTGRAGRSGTSITFVTRGDWKRAQQLIDIMAEANQEIPEELISMAARYTSFKQRRDEEGFIPGTGRGGRGRGGRGGRGGGGRGGRGGYNRGRDDDEEDFFFG